MRIIGGKYKGKIILLPTDKKTRPLRDMVKESVFNLIKHSNKFDFKIEGSHILDLFSGSGSFGLECISRGSDKIFFVENYSDAIIILKKNISNLRENNKCKIIEKSCFEYLKNFENLDKQLDLVFMDPPYKEKKVNFLIEEILGKKILKKNGVIIIHRHKKDDLKISQKLKILDERIYGISKIIIGN